MTGIYPYLSLLFILLGDCDSESLPISREDVSGNDPTDRTATAPSDGTPMTGREADRSVSGGGPDTHPGGDPGTEGSPTEKTRLQERLDVSEAVLSTAVDLYSELQDADARAFSADALPVAVIYIAIRQRGIPRSIEEVAGAADVSPPELYRTARFVSDELGQGIPPAEPELYVGRLADETDLTTATERAALDVLSATPAETRSGRNPEGLAAAALYLVASDGEVDDVTQRDLAAVSSVSPETLRRNYKQLRDVEATD
jgi:transcription initiation factor TFIIIB Brf1 subunit/transcription initiation factor TFIIB